MVGDLEGYLTREALSRVQIDQRLRACGWDIQDRDDVNLYAAKGVAVREFILREGHGQVDYLLFVDQHAVGCIEAKPLGTILSTVEEQSAKYAAGLPENTPSPFGGIKFVYEATGTETQFTNLLDPNPRARRPFTFHRPETLARWIQFAQRNGLRPTLRHRLSALPPLDSDDLWPAQARAIANLEMSFAADHPRALIQMATGSGKTIAAAHVAYRLVRHAKAVRVLFLVDRANLGRQTLKEFQNFITPEGRRFTSIYNVQHLTSNALDPVANVTISTIQRLYAMLRGKELKGDEDEWSGYERQPTHSVEVEYDPDVPIESFDFIIVDECHRSIYGVWRQVLEYFDAHVIGLTATPSKQTYGFFNQNLVMEYDHGQAVADGVNVDYEIYRIRTRITEQGSVIDAGKWAGFRDRQTRLMRWQQLDQPLAYRPEDLDRRVEAPDQIRTVIRTFKDKLQTEIFPGRREVPKTLIFAKTDAHADTILQIVREEFRQGNQFARKITYRSKDDKPENLLAAFRNSFLPRIAVSVDMIATGTDIKPLECLVFMRAPKSRTFFEQMKGRGVRVIPEADFRQVTPDAQGKTHFMIVDAVGVTETQLNDTQPLERSASVPLRNLLESLALGQLDPAILTSVASRLARLDRRLKPHEREELEDLAGCPLSDLTRTLIESADPDRHLEAARQTTFKDEPSQVDIDQAANSLMREAAKPFASSPDLRQRLVDIGRSHEQAIDEVSKDELLFAGGAPDAAVRARASTQQFRQYIEEHRDEITALQILYNIPWRERLTFDQIKELARALETAPQHWTPRTLWAAYQALDSSKVRGSPQRVLTDLVSIVRYALGHTSELVAYPELVEARYQQWLAKQRQSGREFTAEQLRWLSMIKDHIAASLHIATDDFNFSPFSERGGIGRAAQLFGTDLSPLLDELNRELAA